MLIIISIFFFILGIISFIVTSHFETSVISFIISIVLFIGYFMNKHDKKKVKEREIKRTNLERERNEIREELLKRNISICKEINKKFSIPKCSKCNDINFRLREFNTQLDGIRLECTTCDRTFWIKSEQPMDKTIHEQYIEGSAFMLSIVNPIDLVSNNTENQYQKRHNLTSSVKREVWNRDGGKCVKCGSRNNIEYDHIIPVSKGGSNTARNIELLCEKCNRKKSANIE